MIDIERLKVDESLWPEEATHYIYELNYPFSWTAGFFTEYGDRYIKCGDDVYWKKNHKTPIKIIPRPKTEWVDGLPSQKELKEKFDYDPATGLVSKKGTDQKIGHTVKKKNKLYTKIYHAGKSYYAHRLIWAMVYGSWPDKEIDHINGDSEDNCLANLRLVSRKQNCQNQKLPRTNKSGYCGVSWHELSGKWRARVKVDGVEHYIGLFDDLQEAAKVVKEKRAELGFHENHGSK